MGGVWWNKCISRKSNQPRFWHGIGGGRTRNNGGLSAEYMKEGATNLGRINQEMHRRWEH